MVTFFVGCKIFDDKTIFITHFLMTAKCLEIAWFFMITIFDGGKIFYDKHDFYNTLFDDREFF
jgi:hypothetical protein